MHIINPLCASSPDKLSSVFAPLEHHPPRDVDMLAGRKLRICVLLPAACEGSETERNGSSDGGTPSRYDVVRWPPSWSAPHSSPMRAARPGGR